MSGMCTMLPLTQVLKSGRIKESERDWRRDSFLLKQVLTTTKMADEF